MRKNVPCHKKWSLDYDEEADILYVKFKHAKIVDNDSLDDKGLITASLDEHGKVVGLVIMEASKFNKSSKKLSSRHKPLYWSLTKHHSFSVSVVQKLGKCFSDFKLEDNGYAPLLFFQWTWQIASFLVLRSKLIAGWLRRILQAEQTKNG